MTKAKVVFLHGLTQPIVDLITSCAPHGFSTIALEGRLSEEEQMEAAGGLCHTAQETIGILNSPTTSQKAT